MIACQRTTYFFLLIFQSSLKKHIMVATADNYILSVSDNLIYCGQYMIK